MKSNVHVFQLTRNNGISVIAKTNIQSNRASANVFRSRQDKSANLIAANAVCTCCLLLSCLECCHAAHVNPTPMASVHCAICNANLDSEAIAFIVYAIIEIFKHETLLQREFLCTTIE